MNYGYEKKLLTSLVEGYRKSKKDTGDNRTNRRTKLKPEKLYNRYHSNDGDFEKIVSINDTVQNLRNRGYVTAEYESFGTDLAAIFLVDDKINEIEKYLADEYGYISKDHKLEELARLIEKYQDSSRICNAECTKLKEMLDSRKMTKTIEKSIDMLDDLFRVVSFVENNQTSLYIREVSMIVYGDSKYFENNTLDPLCSLLQKYDVIPVDGQKLQNEDYLLADEILKRYHISKEPQKLSIRGNVLIRIDGKDVDISGFTEGIEFTSSELTKIESVRFFSSVFMTIENRTSYLRYQKNDVVTFYLGGYANRAQRDFIRLVYKNNPNAMYLHFGDIDAGGFWIHHHLCQVTDVPFGMFHMSIQELLDPRYKMCLHALTENDVVRMREMVGMPEYREVAEYMLKNRVKLEQEAVSLRLMEE